MVECTIKYEYTDNFGGEANYAWVKGIIPAASKEFSELSAVRRVKRALGLSGVRCKRETWGGEIILRPCGSCAIVFISFHYFGSVDNDR